MEEKKLQTKIKKLQGILAFFIVVVIILISGIPVDLNVMAFIVILVLIVIFVVIHNQKGEY